MSAPSPLLGFSNYVWQMRAFNVFLYVLRFINTITKANFATSFRLMKRNVFMLVEDRASDFDFYKYGNYLKYEVFFSLIIRKHQNYK